MSASTRPQPTRSWRRRAWRTDRCEQPTRENSRLTRAVPERGGKSMASKTSLALAAALSVGVPLSLAQAQTGTSAFPGVDPVAIEDLVIANRILANEKVLDGFGHVSIRDPRDPNRYLMSRSIAPATVTADDIMEYDLDSKPVDAKGRGSYKERLIHGEIYKVRPDVNAIIHSHSPTIVPFSVTKYPLKPILHNAAFLGGGPPVFDTRDVAGPTNLLVETPALGRAIAQTLGKANIVLMRGHRTQCEAGDVLGDLRGGECASARPGDRDRWADHLHRRRGTKARPRQQRHRLRAPVADVEARGDAVEVTCRGRCDCERQPSAACRRPLRAASERRASRPVTSSARACRAGVPAPNSSSACRRPTPSAAAGGPDATAAARNSRAPRRTSGRCR